jgi:hypothetical protein
MAAAERRELDADPMWSENGQVMWLLDQRDADEELLPLLALRKSCYCSSGSCVNWRTGAT